MKEGGVKICSHERGGGRITGHHITLPSFTTEHIIHTFKCKKVVMGGGGEEEEKEERS